MVVRGQAAHGGRRQAGEPCRPRSVGGHHDGARTEVARGSTHQPPSDVIDRALQTYDIGGKPLRQLVGKRLHAASGQRRSAAHEGTDQQVDEDARCLLPVLREDAGKEGLEHTGPQPAADTGVVEGFSPRHVGQSLQPGRWQRRRANGIPAEAQLLAERPGQVVERSAHVTGSAPRIGEDGVVAVR